MRPHYKITQRAIPPAIDYTAAADQLRVDSEADQTYIEELIEVACDYVTDVTGRVGAEATFLCVAGTWESLCSGTDARKITLHRTPLISVESIHYYAPGASALTLMDEDDYRVISALEPGIIEVAASWPTVDSTRADAIQIEFVAGHYLDNPAPATWRHAAKMLVAHLYEERKPVAFASCQEIPYSLKNLIEHNRMEGRFA